MTGDDALEAGGDVPEKRQRLSDLAHGVVRVVRPEDLLGIHPARHEEALADVELCCFVLPREVLYREDDVGVSSVFAKET